MLTHSLVVLRVKVDKTYEQANHDFTWPSSFCSPHEAQQRSKQSVIRNNMQLNFSQPLW